MIPEIVGEIRRSNFVALDTEFSGVGVIPNSFLCQYPSERYHVLKEKNENMLMLQLGLSCFTDTSGSWRHRDFDVLVFPGLLRYKEREDFVSTPSSLRFLVDNGFEIDAVIHRGTNYLSVIDEIEVRQKFFSDSTLSESAKHRQLSGLGNYIGVRRIYDELKNSTVVYHNSCLDLIHILKMKNGFLPLSLNHFKTSVLQMHGSVYDTKVLAEKTFQKITRFSDLGNLKNRLGNYFPTEVYKTTEDDYDLDSARLHNAASDAFVTGMVFLAAHNVIDAQNNANLLDVDIGSFRNIIYWPKHLWGSCINLEADEENFDRSNILYVEFHESKTRGQMLESLMFEGSFKMHRIDSRCAFIECHNKQTRDKALTALSESYRIETYLNKKSSLENIRLRDAGCQTDHVQILPAEVPED